MAALEEIGKEFVLNFLSCDGHTTKDLSDFLQTSYPGKRRFSVRCLERFCKEHGIKRKGFMSDESLDEVVKLAVSQVSFLITSPGLY